MTEDYNERHHDKEEDNFFENKLRKQLEKQLFWWIKVNGKAEGVLVFVGKDFIVLVGDDCKITEVNLDEIETITKRAAGCPCRDSKDHHHHKDHHRGDYED